MSRYTVAGLGRELRQSEIITDLTQFTYDVEKEEVVSVLHSYIIVLSQDCDLLWDYNARSKNVPGDLNGVLLFEAEPTQQIRPKLGGSDIYRRIKRHGEERYHLMEPVPAALDLQTAGLPELIVDFKRCFTLPSEEIYRQLQKSNARRRCRLEMPFREHIQNRLGFYLQRVALPGPEEVQDIEKK